MRLLGSTDTILLYARTYAACILISAPLMTSSFVLNNILRYEGKASLAMIGLTAGGFLNIFGDWVLMTKFHMGILGAGISTAVSQVVDFFLSSQLAGWFRNDPAVIEIGTFALRAQLLTLFLQPMSVCANMMFQSIGKNGTASFLAMLRSGICFIPVIFLLPRLLGLTGVEVSQTVADFLTFVITVPFVVQFFQHLQNDA